MRNLVVDLQQERRFLRSYQNATRHPCPRCGAETWWSSSDGYRCWTCYDAFSHDDRLQYVVYREAMRHHKEGVHFETFFSRLTREARCALLDEVQLRLMAQRDFAKPAGRTAHWISSAIAELGGDVRRWPRIS